MPAIELSQSEIKHCVQALSIKIHTTQSRINVWEENSAKHSQELVSRILSNLNTTKSELEYTRYKLSLKSGE